MANENEVKVNMSPSAPVIYADECIVDNSLKINITTKDSVEHINKIGKVSIMCIDQQTKTIVGKIMMDPFTAQRLGELLTQNVASIISEINNPNLPPEVREKLEKSKKEAGVPQISQTTYIG